MDHLTSAFPLWLASLIGAWMILGLGVYFFLVHRVVRDGGNVSAREFGSADLITCAVFMVWFVNYIALSFKSPEHQVTEKLIVESAALYLGVVAFIAGFLWFRGIDPVRQFGVLRRNLLLCIPLAAGLLICAYPLVLVAERVTDAALQGKARPQNIVEFFINASEGSDKSAVYLTMFMAVVVAPAVEETIFRGYLYGVLKRYAGGVRAALVSAVLFAAMHGSLSVLPGLFVLALCFTLAYEATGSLVVNILMHSLFNLWNLMVMLYLSHHSLLP